MSREQSVRMEDGFVIVGDEAWFPGEWDEHVRQRAEQDRARREMRARNAPGSVRPTVAGWGRPQGRSDPEPVPITDRERSAQQEPPRQRSDWGHGGLDRGDALTADAPARTCLVRVSADVFRWLAEP